MKRIFLFFAAMTAMFGAPAQAGPLDFSKLLVFGDSLVDSGNAHIGGPLMGLPDPTPPAFGYFEGRFSNGPNLADYLSLSLVGTPATAFLADPTATNFAVGGATAAYDPLEISPSFLPQLGIFGGTLQPIPNDALVLVTFGSNDIREVLTDTGFVDFTPTLQAMQDGLTALLANGAQHILITGMPDIGMLPATRAFGDPLIDAVATSRSIALSQQFNLLAASLAQGSGADVRFFDLFGLEEAVLADPSAFGLPPLETDITCQQAGPAAVLAGCIGYLYFDTIHPTTQVHQVIANAILAQFSVPEPGTWFLMVFGLAALGAQLRAGIRRGSKEALAIVRGKDWQVQRVGFNGLLAKALLPLRSLPPVPARFSRRRPTKDESGSQ